MNIFRHFLALGIGCGATAALATNADWLAPVSGEWAAADNWSSPNFPDNGSPSFSSKYDVTIGAVGGPYVVTLSKAGDSPVGSGRYIDVDSVVIDSHDATLKVVQDSTLTAYNGLHVATGTLLLDDGGKLYKTRLSASPEGVIVTGPTRGVTLQDVTLATDLTAGGTLVVSSDLILENSAISFAAGAFYAGAELGGVGEWRLVSGKPESSGFNYDVLYYESLGYELTIGPDVTVRSMGESVRLLNQYYDWDTGGVVVNEGTILAETADGWFYVEGFRNEGLIRVSGGDSFSASFNGAVGDVELGAGGKLTLTGAPHFNRPLVVGDGAEVWLLPETSATTAAPLKLQPGGELWITPEGIVPVDSTGGAVFLRTYLGRNTYTASELTTLPITGAASVAFSSAGIDLEGGVLDPTVLPSNFEFNPAWIENGTLTGAALPATTSKQTLRNASLDVAATLDAGRILRLEQQSALLQPTVLDGGRLELDDSWTNTGGIVVNSGELQIETPGTASGAIQMNGGRLVLQHSTTFATLQGMFTGTPEAIDIGRSTGSAPRGYLDLEGQTLDLNAWPNTQWTLHSGRIENGSIVGTHEGRPFGLKTWGSLSNVDLDGVKLTGGNLGAGVFNSIWATGSVSTSGTLIDSRVDGNLSGGTVRGVLQIGGSITGSVTFDAGSSIVGTTTLGGGTGRFISDRYTFLDAAYTLPSSVSLVSSTRYNSNSTVNANALTVEGAISVGYPEFQQDAWTDSITFNVTSLETRGGTTITEDGRLYVVGGPWTNSGVIQIAGGEIEAESLLVEGAGSIEGWGDVTGDVTIEGRLTTQNADNQFRVTGSLTLGDDAVTEVTLGAVARHHAVPSWLRVAGEAVVGGDLSLTLSPAFLAEAFEVGDLFAIASATSVSGVFDSVAWDLPWIDLAPVYWNDTVLVQVTGLSGVPSLRGDGNGDGVVNAADYTLWRDHEGEDVPWFTLGDFDGSGHVDQSDHAVWAAAYGSVAETSISVPEPSTTASLLFASTVVIVRRRVG
ncbi:hypothetical protein Pla108_34290 [Botrimarina colliarenosi]|uniref:Autotransporter-associated beta strand repeat protein n=1 Tax=Botrimarina colliarenosi TaxID=2528001 RepID=A0A5C6A5R5_9BACT|nr:PEP-CTERM sorting domain-containing protein [Botrimarina colliarenosi]TWT95284.1 hypothetical protein Pla108_34290 [Botrimarina colliarenosi]